MTGKRLVLDSLLTSVVIVGIVTAVMSLLNCIDMWFDDTAPLDLRLVIVTVLCLGAAGYLKWRLVRTASQSDPSTD